MTAKSIIAKFRYINFKINKVNKNNYFYLTGDNKLLDKVDDAFNYFNDFRLDELKEDDIYYINSFMEYIE